VTLRHWTLRVGGFALYLCCCIAQAQDGMVRFDFDPAHLAPRVETSPGGAKLSHVVGLCSVAPLVDGVADDAAWDDAVPLPEFVIPEPATRVRLCYDDHALYLLAECESDPGSPAQGEARPRDDAMLKDERIHVSVSTTPGESIEYLFMLSVADAIYDARGGDSTWNATWHHAVQRQAGRWVAEVALPFTIFGLDQAPGRLGFNVGRGGPKVMRRSWFNALHTSAAASELVFEEADRNAIAATAPIADALMSSPGIAAWGKSLTVVLDRAYARPQDRWLDVLLHLAPNRPLPDTRVSVRVVDLVSDQSIATASAVPTGDRARLSIDLRTPALKQAEVVLEYVEGEERTSSVRFFVAAQSAVPALPAGRRIPIHLDVPERTEALSAWPVTFGVPFPAGGLWDVSGLHLVNGAGVETPSQKEITGRWALEGAIQWVRFDALVDSDEDYFVEAAPVAAVPVQRVSIHTGEDGTVVLNTGVARYVVATGISPITEVWLGERRVAASAGTRGLYVVDQAGRVASASADDETLTVEARGPIAACVRLEGFYRTEDGVPLARHITRVEAFSGQAAANVTHTLVVSNDTNEVWFREIGWEFAVEAGGAVRGLFNTNPAAPASTIEHPLSGTSSAYMLQAEHTRFGGGTNRFTVTGDDSVLHSGEECGDWAMLAGSTGAFVVACKDAARQHPKEFELFTDRAVLKLFSNRAGEELDFRPASLAQKWNLNDDWAERVAKVETSGAGWSKTHELSFAVLSGAKAEASAAKLAGLRVAPVYASVDPVWVATSGAMGPLHPRSPTRFPAAEGMVDRLFEALLPRGHSTGHYGFMDYYAGPTYGGGSGPCRAGRYRLTYGLRSSIWLVYARSGDRAVREFAEGTNKAYLDNYLSHWEARGKVRGVFTGMGGKPISQLPFYWGRGSAFSISSSTNLNQFLWLYHLTGYRRGRDAVESFAEGLKRGWIHDRQDWRQLMVFRNLVHCYNVTWDPQLRALAEGTFDNFTDSKGALRLTKNRPYGSSLYKTQVDVRAIIEGAQLLGLTKYQQTAELLSRYWWNSTIGKLPVGYMSPLGVVGSYLYAGTRAPAIAGGVDFGLRRASTYTAGIGASTIASIFESLPYAMSVVAARPSEQVVPWVAYRDYGFPTQVLAAKTRDGALDLTVRTPGDELGRAFELRPVGLVGPWGGGLNQVTQRSTEAASVRVPRDAAEGAYAIVPAAHGEHFVIAAQRVPMVLYAPNYWALPEIAPVQRIYFKLTSECRDAQIFFEGAARLYDPAGLLVGETEGQRGWVDLPTDRPGLWSFEPISNRLVRGRNFPPFFAMGSPDFYFEPPVDWERTPPAKEAVAIADDTLYIAGAVEGEKNQALHIGGKNTLVIPAGAPHPTGDGGRFLPYREGTVEFFFRPDWSTFDLGPGAAKRWFTRIKTNRSTWGLLYRIDPRGTGVNLGPRGPSHSLYGGMSLNNPGKPGSLRVWRTEAVFERQEWVHVAWVWGPQVTYGPHKEELNLMTIGVYINGRGRHRTMFRNYVDALPLGTPQTMTLGPVQGAVDDLRISDVQRYTGEFGAPRRDRALRLDEHTRALFHFDGTLEGEARTDGSRPEGVVQ